MNTPHTVAIIHVENVGGILIDFTSKTTAPDQYFGVCHYLCIEKTHRGQGYTYRFVELAEELCRLNDMELKGAFIEDGGQMELWSKLGYNLFMAKEKF